MIPDPEIKITPDTINHFIRKGDIRFRNGMSETNKKPASDP